jgi:DNA polymerase III delta prime subunit
MSEPISWVTVITGAGAIIAAVGKPYSQFKIRMLEYQNKKIDQESAKMTGAEKAYEKLVEILTKEIQDEKTRSIEALASLEIRVQIKLNELMLVAKERDEKIEKQQTMLTSFCEENEQIRIQFHQENEALKVLFIESQARSTELAKKLDEMNIRMEEVLAENTDLHETVKELSDQVVDLGHDPVRSPRRITLKG